MVSRLRLWRRLPLQRPPFIINGLNNLFVRLIRGRESFSQRSSSANNNTTVFLLYCRTSVRSIEAGTMASYWRPMRLL
jgi:hypothetical protein